MKIYSLVLLMLITILGIYSQNLNIQNNKKISKKKKYFEKINLFNIIQIKPYLKIDKENECEYYINDEKINIKQN